MRVLIEHAPAKINLALHVRARRADGYHQIETLFAFLTRGDTVRLENSTSSRFRVTGPFAHTLAREANNLVLAAREAFAARFGPLPPLDITLEKHLPVASGIGGGSADAAATLRALARLKGIDIAKLRAIALSLGSDVPACLLGGSAIGHGRGEDLRPVVGLAGVPVLLVNPAVALSTADVFRAWDSVDRGPLPSGGVFEIARTGRNDLEAPARMLAPIIGDVLDALRAQSGVDVARMSGSGATCFALFADEQARAVAHRAISAAHPGWWCFESALS